MALVPEAGEQRRPAVIHLARAAALMSLAPSLARLAELGEELQEVLPEQTLDVRRHLRAPTPACVKRAYTARHVGAARYFQRAFKAAALKFEELFDEHDSRREEPIPGADWYEEKIAQRSEPPVHNLGWQPRVLRLVLLPWKAEPRGTRCGRGANLATEAMVAAQRAHANEVLHAGAFYVKLYELLEGIKPMAMVLGCGESGANEGIARLGGRHLGIDNKLQAGFIEKFGAENFRLADVVEGAAGVGTLAAAPGVVSAFITLDCQLYSTINLSAIAGHDSDHKQCISSSSEVAGLLVDMGKEVCAENTRGATGVMANTFPHVMSLGGDLLGLRSARPRIWGSAPTPLSSAALQGKTARALHSGQCNGQWRIMPHLDAYGRPDKVPCCRGNTVPLHGKSQPRLPIGLLCETMGLAPDAMSWRGLTQAVAPSAAAFVFGQQVKSWLQRHRGMPDFDFGSKAAIEALTDWAEGRGKRRRLSKRCSIIILSRSPSMCLAREVATWASGWMNSTRQREKASRVVLGRVCGLLKTVRSRPVRQR